MKKLLRKGKVPFLSVLLVAVVSFCFTAAYPASTRRQENEPAQYVGILRLWQIDSFEGGKGSRAAFLNAVARIYEQENEGIYIMVSAYTVESAALAIAEGDKPDLISFGGGADYIADLARVLPSYSCAAAAIGGETCAVPWCRGAYFLFTAEGDFSDVDAQNTVLSQGRGAIVEAAAYMAGLLGEFTVESSVQAYLDFMQGKYRYMVGTQRDVWRFETRGFAVRALPLSAYCDLFQYISVCAAESETYAAALGFVELLLSDTVQQKLTSIGMLGVNGSLYAGKQDALAAAELESPQYTPSLWLSEESSESLRDAAALALRGDESGAKNFKNYLVQAL